MGKSTLVKIQNIACWCGDTQWEVCFRTSRIGLVRCPSCGVYRIDPPPIMQQEEVGDFYTNYYAMPVETTSKFPKTIQRKSRFWRVVDRVPELAEVKQAVVDIGCGEGTLCSELHLAGWTNVIGVDVSSSRIARARQTYPHLQFYDRPLHKTAVPLGTVDLLIMDNVIEHLIEPGQMLRQLQLYLKPNGRIVIITPNMSSGHFRLLGRRWTPELAPHAHIFLFTQASLRHLLEEKDFLVESTGSFHLPPYPLREWIAHIARGDIKEAVWRAVQEMGGLYGRLLDSGPMLYAIARKALNEKGYSIE